MSDPRPRGALPDGTEVEWDYRGKRNARGIIAGIASPGASHAATRYRIRPITRFKGEPAEIIHYGRAIRRVRHRRGLTG